MIGYLEGEVIGRQENNLLLKVKDVGYDITIPDDFPVTSRGEKIEIFTYTYVREDLVELFGFETREHKKLFQELLNVSRIGPRVAMNIISTLTPQSLISAVVNEELSTLKEVSGIGPKSGQRLILELEGRLDDLVAGEDAALDIDEGVDGDKELYSALNNLGYRDAEIDSALKEIKVDPERELEEKIRLVLNQLGKE